MENKNTVSLFQILRNSYPRVICCNAVFFSSIHFFFNQCQKTVKWLFKNCVDLYLVPQLYLTDPCSWFHATQAEFITMAVFHKLKSVVVLI